MAGAPGSRLLLQDALYALLNFPSDSVHRDDDETLILNKHKHLHATDAALLNRILHTANLHRLIDHHIKVTLFHKTGKQPDPYAIAMAQGLEEILQPYRATVLDLEQRVMLEQELSLDELKLGIDEFMLIMLHLCNIVKCCAHLCGVTLLDAIDAAASGAVAAPRASIKLLNWHVQRAFLTRLHAWLLYGELLPTNDGFFIRSNCVSEDTSGSDDPLKLSAWTSYEMAIGEKPRFIPTRLAETILFVGKAVRVLRMAEVKTMENWVMSATIETTGKKGGVSVTPAQERLEVKPHAFKHEGAPANGDNEGNSLQEQGNLLHILEIFAIRLSKIRDSAEPFELGQLETLLYQMERTMSARLWEYLWDNGLTALLRGLKDHFLIGRGEMYHGLLGELGRQTRVLPSKHLELQTALQHAAGGVDDEYVEKISLHLPQYSPGSSAYDIWKRLTLKMEVGWPLQLLVGAVELERYSEIFSFLLLVKRVQMDLHAAWCNQKESAVLTPETRSLRLPLWRLRAHMGFFVDNLQYYLQVDVLDTQWVTFTRTVNDCADFEELVRVHEATIAALQTQCFLQAGAVANALNQIFISCLFLCDLLSTMESIDETVLERQIASLEKEFRRQVAFFISYLSGVSSPQASPHLGQLLLRLNFNEAFQSHDLDATTVSLQEVRK